MRKHLSAVGNSLGIIIEKPILELLHIDKDTELELSTDGVRLILEPVRPAGHRRRVAATTARALGTHKKLLEKPAK
ncbi:MAG: AbrB/MazE/SpoVT family DNA-binding domain-containing protein [Byssovorax sp.]